MEAVEKKNLRWKGKRRQREDWEREVVSGRVPETKAGRQSVEKEWRWKRREMGKEDESRKWGKMPERERERRQGLRENRGGSQQGRGRVWLGDGGKPRRAVGRNEGVRGRRYRGGIRKRERDSEPPDGEKHEQWNVWSNFIFSSE